jgi:outer membrane receptor for Fe3+-dicitrate
VNPALVADPGGINPAAAYCPNSRIIGYCSEMANIGKEIHQGIELEVRSTPFARLKLNASYSFLNRSIAYDFGSLPAVSPVNTTISILPAAPKNKAVATASVRVFHQMLGVVNFRYEGGITLQDTMYPASSRSICRTENRMPRPI